MKKMIFCVIGFFTPVFCELPINIAFVHIGSVLPSYIKSALHQARIFNADAHLYLICERVALDSYADKSSLSNDRVDVVFVESLTTSDIHHKIRKYYRASLHFRDGYWLKTVERFYYLHELMEQHGLYDLFHLENDTLLYVDLEHVASVFRSNYPGIAGVLNDDEQCFPCFMYFHSSGKIKHYLEFLTEQARMRPEELSLDMHVPIDYMQKFGRDFFSTLPIIPCEYSEKYGLKNGFGRQAKNTDWYCGSIELFDSVFDPVVLGMYFGGVDHKNRKHENDCGPGHIFPCCVYNPSKFAYEWKIDSCGRRVPYMVYGDKRYRINNLHIHSKDLHKFIS